MARKIKESFWITNISKKIVSLSDLGICVYPMRSVNLLDEKHYYLTKEQLLKSAEVGSLFIKRDKIVIRQVAPEMPGKNHIPYIDKPIFPSKQRSAQEPENIKYEELNILDEEYAEENAESAEADHLGKWNNKQ